MRFSVFLYIRLTASCLQKRNGADDTGNTRQFFRSQGSRNTSTPAAARVRTPEPEPFIKPSLFSDYAL